MGRFPAEMYDRRTTSYALHPQILQPWDVGSNVRRGHNHLSGERFVDAIASPVKIALEHGDSVTGFSSLRHLGSGPCALERCTGQEVRRIPTDALRFKAACQGPLLDIREATKPSGRFDKAGCEA